MDLSCVRDYFHLTARGVEIVRAKMMAEVSTVKKRLFEIKGGFNKKSSSWDDEPLKYQVKNQKSGEGEEERR
jgi:hypothetical protein